MGVTVVTTCALYRLRLTYWRLSSCSALSPTRRGSDAKIVPASTRCKPSTRMSRTVKGSTAHAAVAASALATTATTLRRRKRLKFLFICELSRHGKGRQKVNQRAA
ncbi:Uncharacterised protein [Mycobacterium tuberculosis]|nr:Uncharacterised protein [Mycobacterium tuberculosis]